MHIITGFMVPNDERSERHAHDAMNSFKPNHMSTQQLLVN